MRAAQLNRRIKIEKSTVTKNNIGSPIEGFTELRYTWATVNYPSGRMDNGEYGEVSRTDAVFTIRYDSRINYKCRIKYANQYYKIDHIEMIGRDEGLRLRCIKFEEEEV